MDNRAIGVFDSGLGGLTTVKELRRLLPYENIVYLGDTGRVPYGTRGRETIQKYAMQDMAFLQSHNVKMIIAACGTASSAITSEMTSHLGVPFSGVVLPAAQAACASSISGRIGVIGTTATVRSGAYGRAVRGINPDARVFGSACPLFVPLVENGFIQPDNEITIKVARIYLEPIIKFETDTLILGCTHYPIIYDILNQLLDYKVTLIDPGKEVARWAHSYLISEDMLSSSQQKGGCEFFVTDAPDSFSSTADIFLGEHVDSQVTQIDLEAI
ncbi:glutamate racemase [Youxingia wuxianensis]|uniref:Glutamate racemase n=1 Tax=Youxingia wuxianensis TaxID=2763678 RepID=A0A926EQW6_9FIRM|nr:glutamate racemase [Youxingia wuxianensis]MBC8585767.1 glutamate racemase [Youxingia wuxianensis]